MSQPSFNDLNAFITVADYTSFRQAAQVLNIAPSSLSHTIRQLEETLGVRLFNRTTRSVALTEAGHSLRATLVPALKEVNLALENIALFRASPAGTLRINAPETAAAILLHKVVPDFLARYPDVSLDIVAEGRLIDIVAEGFDAGVRLGESLAQGMNAVRFGGPVRFITVASEGYLSGRQAPAVPDDLRRHECIRHQLPSGKRYQWEFSRQGQEITIDVPGRLTLNTIPLMIAAAVDGLGIACVPESAVMAELASGRLRRLLDNWSPPFPGLYLYYPGNRQMPPALRAFIDLIKEVNHHG
ncbi:LysR family transcriptional regulator [Erwinia sp. 9145]|uniref:LysR family transcriptional regulator n=1 Tax=Erwinia sp. 9145 TaxID=1500895 RepID=UPI000555190D|nr:LysR family transcriptional regulator [Erwinia sp. 9145]